MSQGRVEPGEAAREVGNGVSWLRFRSLLWVSMEDMEILRSDMI